jgi:predicted transcriptional regulator of viral defense system
MKSPLNWNIIKRFAIRNTFGFTFQDVTKEFRDKNPVYLARTLARMVGEGMLLKISRDTYHIIPLHADPNNYVPAGVQVARYMAKNEEYYIGYASAMKIHGLTLRSADREFVVTNKRMKPAVRSYAGITCQFIHHDTSRFFGFSDLWITQVEQAMVSDLEKTLVDIAAKPGFGGGIIEVGNALWKAKDSIDHDRLFHYFARNDNKSAKKRFLFLTDLLGLEWTADHGEMKKEIGSGTSLLDPSAADRGSKKKKFGLKINVDPGTIQKEIQT